jgi:hypothetical protein
VYDGGTYADDRTKTDLQNDIVRLLETSNVKRAIRLSLHVSTDLSEVKV